MTLLSRDAILTALDLPHEDVNVPEWGGTVRVQAMTAAARDAYEGDLFEWRQKNKDTLPPNLRARLLARCLCDSNGELLFSSSDLEKLGKKSVKAMDRLVGIAHRLNGMGETAVEDAEKN